MYIVFIDYTYRYKCTNKDFYFLNWIYTQCNLNIDKIWFYYPHLLNLSTLYDLCSKNGEDQNFLYF
jgi:hypothetical protein